MNKIIAVLAMVIVIANPSLASALVIPTGSMTMHFTNWETRVDKVGDTLSGIGRIDQILDANNATVWSWTPSSGEELVMRFDNLTTSLFNMPGQLNFTGGTAQVYYDTTPNFDPTTIGSDYYGVTDGSLYLDLAFATGRNGFYPNDTLTSTITGIGSDAEGVQALLGHGTGLLDVMGGDAQYLFDTNTFARYNGIQVVGYSDISIDTNLFIRNTGGAYPFLTGNKDGWPVWSKDPLGANAVPEPGSMLLLGMGILGLFGLGRKKA